MEYNKDIYALVRHNIRKYRKLRKITQAELAEKAGLSHDYIRQIESDKIAKTFSLQTLYDISKALELDIMLLFSTEK